MGINDPSNLRQASDRLVTFEFLADQRANVIHTEWEDNARLLTSSLDKR
jgi:hypothetical protein